IGYGHGVGLCQYGADGLAQQGKNFLEILHYYYQGIEIKKLALQ
ncbi:MAG TPA: stage II sporulation protein D, partial [Firmicutes bacterium]|nr:stage II sporulation protein D [Bacillota bacterium]